jgi:hypothetical protein
MEREDTKQPKLRRRTPSEPKHSKPPRQLLKSAHSYQGSCQCNTKREKTRKHRHQFFTCSSPHMTGLQGKFQTWTFLAHTSSSENSCMYIIDSRVMKKPNLVKLGQCCRTLFFNLDRDAKPTGRCNLTEQTI